ncbi:MAG: NAD(P)-binding domain-containing protein [Acidobacteriota bacterium]|jgi:thioredoxin reductase
MTNQRIHDQLILGAGMGGLQLGYYLQTRGRDYTILEANERPASFFEHYPRHRTLLSINKVYTGYDDPEVNLRWDWNSFLSDEYSPLFSEYTEEYLPSADDLCRYVQDFVETHGLEVRYGTRIERVSRTSDGVFELRDQNGEVHKARRLVVATGLFQPHEPDIPGIQHAEQYAEVSVDPRDFAGQRVLILGKGNSGFETADNLLPTASLIHLVSPTSIRMAWQTHYVGNLRAINNSLLDSYQLKSQNAVLDATVERIERDGDGFAVTVLYSHAQGERETLYYDRIICCTGFTFDTSIFDESCQPEVVHRTRLPRQTDAFESVNVSGLYFAGTLTQERDYRTATSAFIHGFRYNAQALQRILDARYYDTPWPRRDVAADPEKLTEAVLEGVNRSSALWQLFGVLGDVLEVGENGGAGYFESMPVDHAVQKVFADSDHYYVITLEYGEDHQFNDPFAVERVPRDRVEQSHLSQFLHPIVRRYRGSEMIAEHHVIEDLAAEWKEPEHVEPLLRFFETQLDEVPDLADV